MTQVASSKARFEPALPSAALPRTPLRAAAAEHDVVARLIAETAKGDVLAFEQLYKLLGRRLFSVALAILKQRPAAEDAVQESFLRVWRSAHTFDVAKGTAYAWFVTIVRNRALSQKAALRDQASRREDFDFEGIADDGPDALAVLMRNEEARLVKSCVDRLSANNRRSVELVFFEGLTHRELAQRLSVPVGTAKSWVRRGLDQLGQCMRGDASKDWRDMIAREYAVGALQGAARRGFERRRERDARYCDFADWWEQTLAMLTVSLPDNGPPPARLWDRIRQQIAR